MELQEAIMKQRVVKNFLLRNVPPEKIDAVVKAGNCAEHFAPAQMLFTVITNKAAMEKIENTARRIWLESNVPAMQKIAANPENAPLCNAPVVIVISAPDTEATLLLRTNFVDCSAAAQNMLLSAAEQGLSSCMMQPLLMTFSDAEIKRLVGIPAEHRPYAAVLLGYAAEPVAEKKIGQKNNVQYCS